MADEYGPKRLQRESCFSQLVGSAIARIHQIDGTIDYERVGRLRTFGFGNRAAMGSQRDERVTLRGCRKRSAQSQNGDQEREERDWLCHCLPLCAHTRQRTL